MSLRILAGSLKGRPLAAPADSELLRPTAARRREAAFDILRGRLGDFTDLRLVDLFAGTGAVGLEALSQGFAEVAFVENAPKAAAIIRRNLESLGLHGRGRVLQNDATRLATSRRTFDVAFLDPPYGGREAERCLTRLLAGGWLAPGAVVLVEIGREDGLSPPEGLAIAREHPHGAGRLVRLEQAG